VTGLTVYLHEAGIDQAIARRTPVALALRTIGVDLSVPELPGHGARTGDQPYDRRAHRVATVTTVAREVTDLLTTCRAGSATVVGGSLGGLCAIASAVGDNRVRRIGVWSAPLFWNPGWPGADAPGAAWCDPARHIDRIYDRDVLLVLGGTDRWTAPERILSTLPAAERFADAGGRLTVEVLAGHGHFQSTAIAERITSWLAGSAFPPV
jgi:hypothetical protein